MCPSLVLVLSCPSSNKSSSEQMGFVLQMLPVDFVTCWEYNRRVSERCWNKCWVSNLIYFSDKRILPLIFWNISLTGKSTLTESLRDHLGASLLQSPPQCLSPWRPRFDGEPPLIRRAFYALGNYITAQQMVQEATRGPVIVDRYRLVWRLRCTRPDSALTFSLSEDVVQNSKRTSREASVLEHSVFHRLAVGWGWGFGVQYLLHIFTQLMSII